MVHARRLFKNLSSPNQLMVNLLYDMAELELGILSLSAFIVIRTHL